METFLMWKFITKLDAFVRFLATVARIIIALINALDRENNHENPVEKELPKLPKK